MPATMRITPDSELATQEAIRFRIGQIEKDPTISQNSKTKRICALRLRLPQPPSAPKITVTMLDTVGEKTAKALPLAYLLASKKDALAGYGHVQY